MRRILQSFGGARASGDEYSRIYKATIAGKGLFAFLKDQ